jgi:hypothetical protein
LKQGIQTKQDEDEGGKESLRESVRESSEPKKRPTRVYRRVPLWQRIKSFPQDLWFKIEMLPETAPLPSQKRTGQAVAVLFHLIHIFAKWTAPSSSGGLDEWKDMNAELQDTLEEESRFSWSIPIVLLLLVASSTNVLYLFTRVKSYNMHYRSKPVSSLNARFVRESELMTQEPPTISQQLKTALYKSLRAFWYFLLGKTPPPVNTSNLRGAHIQQLNVWSPGDFEMTLFSFYSPMHCLVWILFSSQTWITSLVLMGVMTAMIQGLIYSYEALVKDRSIIAAEVFHEYDSRFVNPRLHTVKKDACVMTHEAEMVDYRRRW